MRLLCTGIVWGLLPFVAVVANPSSVSLGQLLRPIAESPTDEPAESVATTKTAPKGATVLLDESTLLQALQDDLADRIEPGDSLRLSLRAQWQPVRVPTEAELLIYTDDAFSPDNRGNWFPQVVLEVDGELEAQWRLPLQVSLFRPVYMAARRLDKGESPNGEAIRAVTCDIYEKRGMPISASEALKGYELTRTLAEGQMLSWSDLARRPDVRRGQMVDVTLERGALSVRMQAQCLADAVVGEPVALRNLRSRQEFNGLVVSADQVRIPN